MNTMESAGSRGSVKTIYQFCNLLVVLLLVAFIVYGCGAVRVKMDQSEFENILQGKWEGSRYSQSNSGKDGKVKLEIKNSPDGNLDISGLEEGPDCVNSSKVSGQVIGTSELSIQFLRDPAGPYICGTNTYNLKMFKDSKGEYYLEGTYEYESGKYGIVKLERMK